MRVTPAHRDAIVRLARTGIPPRVILARVPGLLTPDDVYRVLREARVNDPSIPRFGRGRLSRTGAVHVTTRTILVGVDMFAGLRPHAIRRGVSVDALVRTLLATLVEDKLVDATLDDGCGA